VGGVAGLWPRPRAEAGAFWGPPPPAELHGPSVGPHRGRGRVPRSPRGAGRGLGQSVGPHRARPRRPPAVVGGDGASRAGPAGPRAAVAPAPSAGGVGSGTGGPPLPRDRARPSVRGPPARHGVGRPAHGPPTPARGVCALGADAPPRALGGSAGGPRAARAPRPGPVACPHDDDGRAHRACPPEHPAGDRGRRRQARTPPEHDGMDRGGEHHGGGHPWGVATFDEMT